MNKIYTWGCNPQALRLQAQNSRRARHHGATANSNAGSSNQSSSTLYGNNTLHRSTHSHGSIQQSHLLPNIINSVDEAIVEVIYHLFYINYCYIVYFFLSFKKIQIPKILCSWILKKS